MNMPKALGELRLETYREWSWPASLARLFSRNALAVTVITVLSVLLMLILTIAGKGSSILFGVYTGEDAFYRVILYPALLSIMSALGIFAVAALLRGLANLWLETGMISICQEVLDLFPERFLETYYDTYSCY